MLDPRLRQAEQAFPSTGQRPLKAAHAWGQRPSQACRVPCSHDRSWGVWSQWSQWPSEAAGVGGGPNPKCGCVCPDRPGQEAGGRPLIYLQGAGGPHFPESEKWAPNVHLPFLDRSTDNVWWAGEAGCPQDRGAPRPCCAGWGLAGRSVQAPEQPPRAPGRPLSWLRLGLRRLVQMEVSSLPRPFQGRPTTAPFRGVSKCSIGPSRKAHLCTPK